MAVRIDDTVIDGTVKHKLQELEEQLLSTAVK
jgi:F-type H+-transporting ATPase subunit delta